MSDCARRRWEIEANVINGIKMACFPAQKLGDALSVIVSPVCDERFCILDSNNEEWN